MLPNTTQLPATGFLRLAQIIGQKEVTASDKGKHRPRPAIPAIIPVSRSSWWRGVKEGKYPQPVILNARTTAWRVEDIKRLIESL